MSLRPSKKRKVSGGDGEHRGSKQGQELHTNGVGSENDNVSVTDGSSDVNWDEDEDDSNDGASESETAQRVNGGPIGTTGILKADKVNASDSSRSVGRRAEHTHEPSLHIGNLFDTQVKDLLREVKPKLGAEEKAVEETLRNLKATIEKIPDTEQMAIETAQKHLLSSGVCIPFSHPRPPKDAKYKLSFSKPSYINVVGSYALKMASGMDGVLPIDLVLQMPSQLFTEKDYLNHRYFHKRAFYLACVAAAIKKSANLVCDIRFSYLSGNKLVPIIVVKSTYLDPTDTSVLHKEAWVINILLSVEPTTFPKIKTLPNKNCVRPNSSDASELQDNFPPTPFYNCSLRSDCSIVSFLKILHSAAAKCPGFRDACYLGRVWLRQRRMSSLVQEGGFGNFEWAALTALLLESGGPDGRPVLGSSLSGRQLFSSMVNFLANRNLIKQPLFIGEKENAENFKISGLPVIFEGTTGMNILFKMSPWSYNVLRKDAQASVRVLSGGSGTKFDSLFILKSSEFLDCYDLIAKVSTSSNLLYQSNSHSGNPENLYNTLCKGLTDRVAHINIMRSKPVRWTVKSAASDDETILIGIVIDPVNGARTVDRGPAAEDTKAATSFREFWGDKAELRRFRDGQILESVVWSSSGAVNITKEIVLLLLKRLIGDRAESYITFIGNDISKFPQAAQEHEKNADMQSMFRVLESQLRSLEGLPLQIRQVQQGGTESHLELARDTLQGNDKLMQITVQFEGSARWPDDLKAVQMTKLGFLLKMNQLLSNGKDVLDSQIGVENERSNILNTAFIDIAYNSGGAFRIRIHHDREQALIEKRLADKTLLPREREEAAQALSSFKRLYIHGPLYQQAIQKLRTRFEALPGAIRLLRAWFDAHLLSNHIATEVVDVLAARTFLHPDPWPTPSTEQTAFLRTLLFISRWDWQHQPLIADFGSGMNAADYASISTRFEAWRKLDPLMNRMALFVATDFDREGTTWTEHRPEKVVAARIKSLAAAARKLVKDKGLDLTLSSLFKSRMVDYDFVLKLNRSFTGKETNSSNVKTKYKNLHPQVSFDFESSGFDPVRKFVEEIEKLYGDCAIFFYGQGADVIGGLWNPNVSKRNWKFNLGYSTIPTTIEEEMAGGLSVTVNKDAILMEITRLGADIISSVDR